MKFSKQLLKIWAIILLAFLLFFLLGYINFAISHHYDVRAFGFASQHAAKDGTPAGSIINPMSFDRILIIILGCITFNFVNAQIRESGYRD